MNPDILINITFLEVTAIILKFGSVLVALVNILFSFVVTRQVRLRIKSFSTPDGGIFRFVALMQLLISITSFLLLLTTIL